MTILEVSCLAATQAFHGPCCRPLDSNITVNFIIIMSTPFNRVDILFYCGQRQPQR